MIPLYVKKAYKDNPLFSDAKVIYSVYDDEFDEVLNPDFGRKIIIDGITNKDLIHYKKPSYVSISKAAIDFADAIIYGREKINDEVEKYLKSLDKPVLDYQSMDTYIDAYDEFYEKIIAADLK